MAGATTFLCQLVRPKAFNAPLEEGLRKLGLGRAPDARRQDGAEPELLIQHLMAQEGQNHEEIEELQQAQVDPSRRSSRRCFVPVSQMVPHFTFDVEVPFFNILVPTVETTMQRLLVENLMSAGYHVLFSGETGVGKSVGIQQFLGSAGETFAVASANFSAQTSSANVVDFLENTLEPGRPVWVLSTGCGARLEKYGAQPPIELLRQVIDYKGFYDRKKLFWKGVQDTQFIAACGPPGGGRMPVEMFFRIIADLLPTPVKCHYTFNLRDPAKMLQGMLMVHVRTELSDEPSLIRLWVHETCRQFRDRLVNKEDAREHAMGGAVYRLVWDWGVGFMEPSKEGSKLFKGQPSSMGDSLGFSWNVLNKA
eukprot:g17027.t1